MDKKFALWRIDRQGHKTLTHRYPTLEEAENQREAYEAEFPELRFEITKLKSLDDGSDK